MSNTDIEFPIKRVTGDTMEETLTENALNSILPSRYLQRDENGELDEDPTALFERVAKNVALAEVVYEAEKRDVTIEVTPDQVKKNHSSRDKLLDEITDGNTDNIETIELTEDNIYAFAYDTVVPELENDDIREAVEQMKDEYEQLMTKLSFMPNSPTLMNAGTELQQLSACFVNSPEDDLTNIHNTETEAAKVFQSGGGMGYAFHHLRPYGDQVGTTGGIASGPITFMRTFDQMCETIAQGGKRRGAQMGVMRVTHPDIIHFIHAKNKDVSLKETLKLNEPTDPEHQNYEDALAEASELISEDGSIPKHLRNAVEGHLSNFNISVGITDDFMEAVQNDDEFTLYNPRTQEPHIATEETKEMYSWHDLGEFVEVGEELTIPARKIWDRIIEGAHENGEPGVIFLDRANDDHSFPVESKISNDHDDPMNEYVIHATNPCGEQPLMDGEACNLGHINLSTVLNEDLKQWHKFDSSDNVDMEEQVGNFLEQAIDWVELNERIKTSTRFLENVVTMSDFPVEKINETVDDNRKIGLGIMGLAQMFVQMGLRYGSDESAEVGRQVMKHINQESKQTSHRLSRERGVFNNWEDSKYANPTEYRDWFERQTGESADDWEDGFPIRNHNTTTIAPTGTTSMLGNTSGGCEPFYDIVFMKNPAADVKEGMMPEMDDYFRRTLKANGFDPDAIEEEAVEQIWNNEFDGIRSLPTVPDILGEVFVSSGQVTPLEHAKIQTALQEGVDSGISKTINAANDATMEDAKEAFEYVFEHGGKGVTYYRNGTRSKQVNVTQMQNKEFSDDQTAAHEIATLITDNFDSVTDFLTHEEAQDIFEQKLIEVAHTIVFDREEIDADTKDEIAQYLDEVGVGGNLNINEDENGYLHPRDRPATLRGTSQRIDTGYGKMYVTINEDENGRPFEIFANIGNSGGFTNSFTEALAKVISTALRSGVDPEEIQNELTGIRSPKVDWDRTEEISSIPDAMGIALRRYLNDEIEKPAPKQSTIDEVTDKTKDQETEHEEEKSEKDDDPSEAKMEEDQQKLIQQGNSPECPECGKLTLHISEGCKTCRNCGWSEC